MATEPAGDQDVPGAAWSRVVERLAAPASGEASAHRGARTTVALALGWAASSVALWPVWLVVEPSLLGPLAVLATAPLLALAPPLRAQPIVGLRVVAAGVTLHWATVAAFTGGLGSPAVACLGVAPLLPVLLHDRRGMLAIAGLAALASVAVGWVGAADDGPAQALLGVAVAFTVAVAGLLAEAARRAEADSLRAAQAESNRALADARDAAAAARAQRSDLIASMSHELRTPLDGILGVSDFLLRSSLDRAQRDHVETIRASANALVEQMDDLLDVGRIEAGAAPITAAPFDPVALARQVADLLRARAREKGVRLTVDIAPRVPARVTGDAGRLRQILLNLVGNGVKYTHEGTVTLRVSVAEEPGDLPLLRFDVEDTGIGIAREDHARIFDRFTEAGGYARSVVGGTGLGLSISRHLVARMGGAIHVESEPGVGSRFRVELRLPTDAGEPAQPDTLPPLPPARVLVAEDNPLSRKVTVAMLDHLGCVGDTAVHGEQAVQLASANRYDLVLMDCEMPIVDGLEATRRLRAAGATLPIVALTAHVLPEVRRRCEDAGMDDVMEKPVRLEKLHRVLARWLIGP